MLVKKNNNQVISFLYQKKKRIKVCIKKEKEKKAKRWKDAYMKTS